MWQIITLKLSVICTQGLFVVTQIAGVVLVTGRMTFAKVWCCVLGTQKSSFYATVCYTNTHFPIKTVKTLSGEDRGQVSHKWRQIGDNDVSLPFILSCPARTRLPDVQTNAAGDYVRGGHPNSSCQGFVLAKDSLQDSSWQTKKIVSDEHRYFMKALSKVISTFLFRVLSFVLGANAEKWSEREH